MTTDADPEPAQSTSNEVTRLRAERDAAVAALKRRRQRSARMPTVRRLVVGVLVVAFGVLLPVTAAASWGHRTVLNTGAYVKTIAPIAKDPAVTTAVSKRVTDEVYAALNPEQVIANALPDNARFLAGPIANGSRSALQQSVNAVLQSDQFQQLWVGANRFAHAELVAVLRGNTPTLQTTNGLVVLNLVPLVNAALQRAETFVSGVTGRPLTLPTITSDELPAVACARIAAALDRQVPATCGQIVLFDATELAAAQHAVRAFDRAVLALLVLTPLIVLAALWLSRQRRRTLLQLATAGILGVVVVRRVFMWQQQKLVDTGDPDNRDARHAIVSHLLGGFYALTWWILLGGLVVVAFALLSGPSHWAAVVRARVANGARKIGQLAATGVRGASADREDVGAVVWVRRHVVALRVGGVVAVVAFVLIFDVNLWWTVVILLLLGGYELWLRRLAPGRENAPLPPAPPASTAGH
jgi:hypothetical protein